MVKKKETLIGIVLFILSLFLLSGLIGQKMAAAIGTLLLMGTWWITSCVPVGVTSAIPIIVNALFELTSMSSVISNYASETAILLFGSDIIALSWNRTGLDKRIGLKSIGLIGTSVISHIIVWTAVSAILSCFLPNVVVCAVLLPIVVSMSDYLQNNNSIRDLLLICVVWGCGLGGIGTPLGGAMNLVAIEHIENLIGREYLFFEWTVRFLPLMLLLLAVCIAVMLFQNRSFDNLEGSKQFFQEEYKKLPVMSKSELLSLLAFLFAILLSFSRGWYADLLPLLKPAYVFLSIGIILMMIPIDGEPVVTWKYCESHIFWGTIFMFSGGMALGKLVIETGFCDMIAAFVSGCGLQKDIVMYLLILFTMVMSEISNNTSAAAISVPLAIGIFASEGAGAIGYLTPVCLAFNSSFMLPTTVRSLAVGYGLDPEKLLRKGLPVSIIVFVVICIVSRFV